MNARLCAVIGALLLGWGATWVAAEPATVEIVEPLGTHWPADWVTQAAPAGTAALQVLDANGQPVPAQRVGPDRVLFLASLKPNSTNRFQMVAGDRTVTKWQPVVVDGPRVRTGLYTLDFSGRLPLPRIEGLPATSAWPSGVVVTGVQDEWLERGPARAILRRSFAFANPAHRYVITFDCRAQDPWIGVVEQYAFGRGSFIKWDLAGLNADRIYHPHSYNARNSQVGGDQEDSTLQPPVKHPIATLGPIWRDIWFGGGPFAFVYATNAVAGLGVATVRGSQWDSPADVPLESQNFQVHGDPQTPGKVWIKLPTDGGTRHWAIVPGPVELRKRVPDLIRRRVEIPLEVVLREWVLDWPGQGKPLSYGILGAYLGGSFNEHQKCPTTIPRRVKGGLPKDGGPYKSRDLAALAYIFTNPDYWPGPRYRWQIGNPNFHTDMYPTPFLIGLLMPDHPHAKRWVEFGIANLKDQIDHDSFPGGSWKESISYSGAFFSVARYLQRARQGGFLNAFRDWPRIREVAVWFAGMETPVDPRFNARQQAPLGDTGFGSHVGKLNELGESYRGVDDQFAEQLRRFPEPWAGALDIGSRQFFGFGAMLRGNAYDTNRESYVTIKAGPARNHYQGDELSFYFHSLSTPLAIDYACHYSPRPWHAAMHNRPDMNDQRPVAIGVARAFATNTVADVFVADEQTREINHVPLVPHETTKPGWEYPTRFLPADQKPWTFRRYTMLVKHNPAASRLADYLVVRDEIESPEPVWWNLHILARRIQRAGQRFLFAGQLGVDTILHVLTPTVTETQQRRWGWGGSIKDRRGKTGADYEAACFGRVIPEDFTPGTWKGPDGQYGEQAEWLRLRGVAGKTEWLTVLMPHRKGEPAPTVEKLSATSARITLDNETEIVHLGSDAAHQAAVERAGKLTVLLPASAVKPWNELPFAPLPAGLDQGGR
jgi:hypothetical protein